MALTGVGSSGQTPAMPAPYLDEDKSPLHLPVLCFQLSLETAQAQRKGCNLQFFCDSSRGQGEGRPPRGGCGPLNLHQVQQGPTGQLPARDTSKLRNRVGQAAAPLKQARNRPHCCVPATPCSCVPVPTLCYSTESVALSCALAREQPPDPRDRLGKRRQTNG